jgi:hypothetical protein
MGRKLYTFRAIDPFKKDAAPHIGATASSLNSKAALKKRKARYGKGIGLVEQAPQNATHFAGFYRNDNSSENMGKAEEYISSQHITRYSTSTYKKLIGEVK